MAKVKVRVKNQDPKYTQAVKGYENSARRIVAYALNETRNNAVKGILAGNKSGRVYTRRGVTHQASAVGEYPASDTGFLASNIHVVKDSNGLGGAVESRAEYSQFLEFGTTKMGARPFMQPSVEQVRPTLRRRLKELFG